MSQQGLRLGVSNRNWAGIKIFHVVTAIEILDDMPPIEMMLVNGIFSYFPVEPKVSMAYISPSSIFVAGPPLTIGTLLPAWI